MCYRKLRILNPVKDEHLTGFDKYRINVQCGKCPSCRKQRSKDWLFRAFFEFKDSDKAVFFATLTYDDFHLPRYNGKPCFDNEHVRLFFARLRKYIGKFRYFRASEYGGFTHRPHYHFIFSPDDSSISFNKFAKSVQICWYYGAISQIDYISNGKQSFLKTLSYLTEYTTKDLNFDVSTYEKDMPSRYSQRLSASKGFGSSFLDLLDYETLQKGFYFLPIGKNGILVRFQIPRYYELKLCFDYAWHPELGKAELVKNSLGTKLSVFRHNLHYVNNLENLYNSRNVDLSVFPLLRSKLSELGMSWKSAVYNCFSNFDDIKDFVYYRDFISVSNSVPELKYDNAFNELYYTDFAGEGYYLDNLTQTFNYHPKWSFYEKVYDVYLSYRQLLASVKDKLECEKEIEKCKARTRAKIRRDPRLRRYLFEHNINVSKFY